ncbi:c-type cytochrome [Verrucomicrobiales bacterium]|nr:c-type cytochrome [Verrucomicrobiales bacterium]
MKDPKVIVPALTFLFCFCFLSSAQDKVIDYAALLPPLIPVEPEDALKTFKIQPGFKIELVAAEPLIADPVEIAFDARGRLWVLEFTQYNQEFHGGDTGKRGRLKILEDIDGDGRMDKATTFIDDLDYSSAFLLWNEGVYLGSTPEILYLADTDADGKADQEEVVYTGFSREEIRAGQAQMNSFRWGFDNRIHVCTNSGGSVRRADNDDQRPVNVHRRGFAFDPHSRQFAVGSGGGQHGQTFDRWGNRFNCQSSYPNQFVIYDSRYLRNNPWMPAPSSSILISDGVKNERLHTISPPEPWRILRNRMRVAGEFRGSADIRDGKVQDQGYITSASGLTFYTGNAFPESYLADAFIGEPANNLVYRAKVEREGLSFRSRHVGSGTKGEFLASTDNYFRPVQFSNGPDGALYVVDMYREVIEGGGFLPPKVVEHLNMASGDNRGRIYRILPEEANRRPLPTLANQSTEQLVALLDHPNGWHRDTAARLLWERQDAKTAIPELRRLVENTPSALGRTRARYLLHSFDAYDIDLALAGLKESDPDAIVHSLRLADKHAPESALIRDLIITLGDHPAEEVRYQALFSCGEFFHLQKADLLARRLQQEGGNRWMRLAATSAIIDSLSSVFTQLYHHESADSSQATRSILSELVSVAAKSGDLTTIFALAENLTQPNGKHPRLQAILLRTLLLASNKSVQKSLLTEAPEVVRNGVAETLSQSINMALDPEVDTEIRIKHLPLMALADYAEVASSLKAALAPNQDAALQKAALDLIATFDEPDIGEFLVNSWQTFSPLIRSGAIEILLSRTAWALSTISAAEAGKISRGELGPIRIQMLRSHGDEKVSEKATRVFGGIEQEARAAVIARYAPALENKGNPAAGREVFAKSCAACHQLDGMGNAIGARLMGIGKIGREAILQNILDPNRDVKAEYLNYSLLTKSGEAYSGMIQAESTNSVTLQRLDGSSSEILRVDIASLSGMGISFMPAGLEAQIDVEAMSDLLAYLVALD